MPIWDYLVSSAWVVSGVFLVWGVSVPLLWTVVPAVPRLGVALAVLGFQTSLLYLKPVGLSIGWIILLPVGIAYGAFRRAEIPATRYAEFFSPLRLAPVILIFGYALLPFFFRWDPPGSDPVKWGSFARLLLEYGELPGRTWPLSSVEDLRGINYGLPVAIALVRWMSRAPWERIIYFLEGLSLAGFALAGALVSERFFSKRASLWAAFAGLVLFTNPQQYLNWGGTPTLVGMIAGPLLVVAAARMADASRLSSLEWAVWAFAVAGAAHAHPIGIYLSFLLLAPLVLRELRPAPVRTFLRLSTLGAFSFFAFSPFLLKWGLATSPEEFVMVRKWQESMAPYLFRADHSRLYNLYTQISAYLWSTAFLLAVGLGLLAWSLDRRALKNWGLYFLGLIGLTFILVGNTIDWIFPLSFLIYPERVTTVLAFTLAWPFAFYFDRWGKDRNRLLLGALLVAGLGATQFSQRLWPAFGHSVFTPADKKALAKVADEVPPGECVRITFLEAGMWIPVLSLRCTVPYHVLSASTQDEQAEQLDRALKFEYVSPGKKPVLPIESWLIDENGARLGKVK